MACLVACGPDLQGPWARVEIPTTNRINALFGFSATDVWAAGAEGTVLHFDGQQWAVKCGTTKTINSIWGASPGDVWFAGDVGTLLRWNGSALVQVAATGLPAPLTFTEVYGSSATNVYFCSQVGLFRFETTFEKISSECITLFGTGTGSVRALIPKDSPVCSSAELLSLNGKASTPEAQITSVNKFSKALSVTGTELWLLNTESGAINVRKLAGGSATDEKLALPNGMRVSAMWKNSATDIWLSGNEGRIAHFT